ncbi:DUF6197 family protein [Streptomyces sp. NPDC051561]|uniref:DUF6197 family protein n=1 Tax=Streptomyces sp. NPDC051561 TaxID=3365658 RepID=UPI0037B195AA
MPHQRYSPESIVVSHDPRQILEWAAAHIEHVGLHQGRGLFAGPGRTVTLRCWLRGAIDVAAGHGRFNMSRTYDFPAISQARAEAYAAITEYLAGHPVEGNDARTTEFRQRAVLDGWSGQPGRTAADAARALRTAAARLAAAEPQLF